jgi:RNA polymerase sigma factor (TIGR02999 family)
MSRSAARASSKKVGHLCQADAMLMISLGGKERDLTVSSQETRTKFRDFRTRPQRRVKTLRRDLFGSPVRPMNEVTRILSAMEQGDPQAAPRLLPLVYEELRKLAAQRLAQEKPGQTLQATALVHEAYIRLVDTHKTQAWNSRGHFYAAAALAMRRILVEQARRKQADKRGGRRKRVELNDADAAYAPPDADLLDIDEALTRLAGEDAQAAQLIQLRYFGGLSLEDAAEVVGLSRSSAYEHWAYARARLRCLLQGE